jgi:hypothetical protein
MLLHRYMMANHCDGLLERLHTWLIEELMTQEDKIQELLNSSISKDVYITISTILYKM